MEDGDPVVALRACIAAVKSVGGQLDGGSNIVGKLEQSLCRVQDALREKEREIERLKKALEQRKQRDFEEKSCESREVIEQRSSDECANEIEKEKECALYYLVDAFEQTESENVTTSGSVGVSSLSSDQDTNSGRDLELDRDRMTPVYESMTISVLSSEETSAQLSSGNSAQTERVSEPESLKERESTQASTEGRFCGLRGEGVEKEAVVGGEEGGSLEGVSGQNGEREGVDAVTGGAREMEGVEGGPGVPRNTNITVQVEVSEGMEDEATVEMGRERGELGHKVVGPHMGSMPSGEMEEAASAGVAMEDNEGYQKVEFAALYYHTATGYYYDPLTQQFFAPTTSGYQATVQSNPEAGQASVPTEQSENPTVYQSGPTSSGNSQTGYNSGQTSSVADILAAVSEQASQKCGYTYDEATGMYYDHRYAMYYDQESQLYYDPECGTYYEYDTETRQYQVHSRVKLPSKRSRSKQKGAGQQDGVIDLCSSSESDNEGSVEEGELRYPKYPEGSPPPEEEWAPCLRLVVGSSECVPRGSVYVVTQEGAKLGREPGGSNPVALREVQVSKSHVEIKYSRSNECFTLCDLGSQNGTFLNNQRLSEPKQRSKPHPLTHCDTFTIGTTSFTLHIHTGWDTCEWCRWEERGEGEGEEKSQEGKTHWKKELNRIKKRYGLRMKDTYGEDPVRTAKGYQDRAAGRRQTVGSDMPELSYPDAPPSSVHRALPEDSVGHKMLQKLGWKKGEGLGKGSKGITEPVKADVREVRSGLGSMVGGGKHSLDTVGSESAAKHRRLMKHYSDVVARENRQSKH